MGELPHSDLLSPKDLQRLGEAPEKVALAVNHQFRCTLRLCYIIRRFHLADLHAAPDCLTLRPGRRNIPRISQSPLFRNLRCATFVKKNTTQSWILEPDLADDDSQVFYDVLNLKTSASRFLRLPVLVLAPGVTKSFLHLTVLCIAQVAAEQAVDLVSKDDGL